MVTKGYIAKSYVFITKLYVVEECLSSLVRCLDQQEFILKLRYLLISLRITSTAIELYGECTNVFCIPTELYMKIIKYWFRSNTLTNATKEIVEFTAFYCKLRGSNMPKSARF